MNIEDRLTISVNKQKGSITPVYASEGAAGADIHAFLEEPMVIPPGERALVLTGLRIEIPFGFEGQIRPRSGLALKNGVTVLNSPGTIDSDFRGEIGIILINLGSLPFTVFPGDRIAQIVFSKVARASFEVKKNLAQSERGSGGFGSTGQ